MELFEVQVKMFASLANLAQKRELLLEVDEKTTVRDLLNVLIAKCGNWVKELIDPKTGEIKPQFRILINDKDIGVLEGLNTKILKGDRILIMPILSGG